jgi:hypothetical protein
MLIATEVAGAPPDLPLDATITARVVKAVAASAIIATAAVCGTGVQQIKVGDRVTWNLNSNIRRTPSVGHVSEILDGGKVRVLQHRRHTFILSCSELTILAPTRLRPSRMRATTPPQAVPAPFDSSSSEEDEGARRPRLPDTTPPRAPRKRAATAAPDCSSSEEGEEAGTAETEADLAHETLKEDRNRFLFDLGSDDCEEGHDNMATLLQTARAAVSDASNWQCCGVCDCLSPASKARGWESLSKIPASIFTRNNIADQKRTTKKTKPAAKFSPVQVITGVLDIDPLLRQQYSVGLNHPVHESWGNYWLSPRGVYLSESGDPLLRICDECDAVLEKGRQPKNAIANSNWIGSALLIPELADLSVQEQILLSIVRTRGLVANLDASVDRSNVKLRRHLFAFETSPEQLATVTRSTAALHKPTLRVHLHIGSLDTPEDKLKAIRQAKAYVEINTARFTTAFVWLFTHNASFRESTLQRTPVVATCGLDTDEPDQGTTALLAASAYLDSISTQMLTSTITTPDNGQNLHVYSIGGTAVVSARSTDAVAGLDDFILAENSLVIHDDSDSLVSTDESQGAQRSSLLVSQSTLTHASTIASNNQFGGSNRRVFHGSARLYPSWDRKNLALMYPILYPFGTGAFEVSTPRQTKMSMDSHLKRVLCLSDRAHGSHFDFVLERTDNKLREQALAGSRAVMTYRPTTTSSSAVVTGADLAAAQNYHDQRQLAILKHRTPPVKPSDLSPVSSK